MAPRPKIRCRQIAESDLDSVIDLLVRGFPRRDRAYWQRGLGRQAVRPVPEGVPRFGYMLDCDGRAVGVLLVLGDAAHVDGRLEARCNLSSWYVDPEYRSYAPLLVAIPLKLKDVTFVNVSPAPHTWPIVEAQGFSPICQGQFTAFPFLAKPVRGVRVRAVTAEDVASSFPSVPDFDLLRTHADYGCVSLVCSTPDGDYPFVFRPFRRWRDRLPCMRLIYCREAGDFVRFAGPLGRHLLRGGSPWVILDSDGPVEGLVGFYQARSGRKYFKGPHKPRLGDLAYTEFALFGP
ncbi:MAG: acyl-CoA acyltransferase [Bauldia sp.]|uniref:acyl-CoA acyltransferase n=1 Tax=Bauldia sp. TaxID=2575872 RepID=UPI001D4F267F|nr:acyl-CoA acyltransferase [Bauldia sp.]MCB1494718.1 acyl-CoA acyltransferase [Bauldia sp.]